MRFNYFSPLLLFQVRTRVIFTLNQILLKVLLTKISEPLEKKLQFLSKDVLVIGSGFGSRVVTFICSPDSGFKTLFLTPSIQFNFILTHNALLSTLTCITIFLKKNKLKYKFHSFSYYLTSSVPTLASRPRLNQVQGITHHLALTPSPYYLSSLL